MRKFIIRGILIPFLLLSVWVITTIVYFVNTDLSPTILSYRHIDSLAELQGKKIDDREKITGIIKANENFLGILSVNFDKESVINKNGTLVFKIKEFGNKKWYAINRYDVRELPGLPQYPFGFPPITDSKDKTYLFELALINNNNDSITIKDDNQIITTYYQFPKEYLFSNSQNLFYFINNKMLYSMQQPTFVANTFVFLLPLMWYVLWMCFKNSHLVKRAIMPLFEEGKYIEHPFTLMVILLVVISALFGEKLHILYFLLTFLWVFTIFGYKLPSGSSFISGLFLLCLIPVFLLLEAESLAEKTAAWVYIFLSIGALHALLELSATQLAEAPIVRFIEGSFVFRRAVRVFYVIDEYLHTYATQMIAFFKSMAYLPNKLFPKKTVSTFDYVVVSLKVGGISIVLFATVLLSAKGFYTTYNFIVAQKELKELESRKPVIYKVEPPIVYHSTKIVIYGDKFGWDSKNTARLLRTNFGKVQTELWTDTKIILTVPLHWKPGVIYLWVEKVDESSIRHIIMESNKRKVKLIPSTGAYTHEDAEYFNALKHVSEEVLIINGYGHQ